MANKEKEKDQKLITQYQSKPGALNGLAQPKLFLYFQPTCPCPPVNFIPQIEPHKANVAKMAEESWTMKALQGQVKTKIFSHTVDYFDKALPWWRLAARPNSCPIPLARPQCSRSCLEVGKKLPCIPIVPGRDVSTEKL